MSNIQEIERAVRQLSSEELTAFRVWFSEFDAEVWDRQFEEDVAAGRLNALAERALQHLSAGRCTDL
jgi:cobalamin biosynthesis protein CobT